MNKKAPIYRICALNRSKHLGSELFRICKLPNGEIKVDINYQEKGRGAYLKKDLKTIKMAYERRTLSKALHTEVKEDTYLELITLLGKERRG